MLHLRRLGPYALVLATVVVGVLEGPAALGRDDHWLQRLSSVGFFALGVAGFRVAQLRPAMRLALAAGGALLAIDEWVMFHECLKFTAGFTVVGSDLLVPFYGLAGLAVLVGISPALGLSGGRWITAALAVGGAASAVAADAFGFLQSTPLAAALAEEGGEALAIGGALALLLAAPSARARVWPGLAITAAFAATFAAVVALLRPWICPSRLW